MKRFIGLAALAVALSGCTDAEIFSKVTDYAHTCRAARGEYFGDHGSDACDFPNSPYVESAARALSTYCPGKARVAEFSGGWSHECSNLR
jgi:hypothetical protein